MNKCRESKRPRLPANAPWTHVAILAAAACAVWLASAHAWGGPISAAKPAASAASAAGEVPPHAKRTVRLTVVPVHGLNVQGQVINVSVGATKFLMDVEPGKAFEIPDLPRDEVEIVVQVPGANRCAFKITPSDADMNSFRVSVPGSGKEKCEGKKL